MRTLATRPKTATGPSESVNLAKGIPEAAPIAMFCGLPVMVATLPQLEAVAVAIR